MNSKQKEQRMKFWVFEIHPPLAATDVWKETFRNFFEVNCTYFICHLSNMDTMGSQKIEGYFKTKKSRTIKY
jgi:hypothetical protein